MLPEFINESVLWGPLFALGVVVALLLVAAIVQITFQIVIRNRTGAAPERLDTEILSSMKGALVLFIIISGLFLGFLVLTGLDHPVFNVLEGMGVWARRAWLVVVIGEVTYLLSHLTQALLGWYIRTIASRTATDVDAKLLPPVKRVLPLTIYAVGALIIVDSLGVSISPLLAGLGIGGLAVALAVQPTLSNFFAGTYLVMEGELNQGDYIEVEGGPSGYVTEVGWRSTKIRSRYNNLVIIPNSKMVNSIVTNYFSPTPAMNVVVTCGVSYDSDLAHVERVVLEVTRQVIAESQHSIKDVDPFFGFWEFGDSNIDFWLFFQATDRSASFALRSEVIKLIHSRFNEEGIEINYPVRKLVHPPSDDHLPVVGARERQTEHTPGMVDDSANG